MVEWKVILMESEQVAMMAVLMVVRMGIMKEIKVVEQRVEKLEIC